MSTKQVTKFSYGFQSKSIHAFEMDCMFYVAFDGEESQLCLPTGCHHLNLSTTEPSSCQVRLHYFPYGTFLHHQKYGTFLMVQLLSTTRGYIHDKFTITKLPSRAYQRRFIVQVVRDSEPSNSWNVAAYPQRNHPVQ